MDYDKYENKLKEDKDKAQWQPSGNVGLHHYQSAVFAKKSQLITKTKIYKSSAVSNKNSLYISTLFERKCIVLKQYLQHWSVVDLPKEFLVLNKNNWDPHPTNITNIDIILKNYVVIAESERGPQIIEHRNTLATQFHITHFYKDSTQVLHNFIKAKIIQIYSNKNMGMRINEAEYHQRNISSQANEKSEN